MSQSLDSKKQLITVSPNAIRQIRHLLEIRGKDSIGIRVGVKAGGCSGLSYLIEYADETRPFEEEIKVEDVKILIDPKAVLFLLNSEMDYVEEKLSSGFVFKNPNEKGKCGCGKSFHV